MQHADAGRVERVQRRVGMLGAARAVAGVDDGGDAGVERRHRRQPGAQVHVERAILRAQRAGDDIDVGEEIVDIGHHAPHRAEPHVMVGVDQARHDDAGRGVDHLGALCLDVGAEVNIADREVGDDSIHRDDGAAFEQGAGIDLRAHGPFLSSCASGPSAWRPLSRPNGLELSALASDAS